MDSFFKIVLVVAFVALIITLTIVGYLMSQSTSGVRFPPVAAKCPDYWKAGSGSGICSIPASYDNNVGSIFNNFDAFGKNTPGISGQTNIDFSDSGWSKNGSAICGQKTWANTYGIQWDGVSNYNSCKS